MEDTKPTNEQIIINDLVQQLQEKETAIIGYRVTITQLKAQLSALQTKDKAAPRPKHRGKPPSQYRDIGPLCAHWGRLGQFGSYGCSLWNPQGAQDDQCRGN